MQVLALAFPHIYVRSGYILGATAYAYACHLPPRTKTRYASLVPKGSLSLTLFYKISLLPKLHLEQSVCKFSGTVSPPFDQGIIWSTCNSTEGSFAGEAPHAQHLK